MTMVSSGLKGLITGLLVVVCDFLPNSAKRIPQHFTNFSPRRGALCFSATRGPYDCLLLWRLVFLVGLLLLFWGLGFLGNSSDLCF